MPVMASKAIAASTTVLPKVPTVSRLLDSGMTPLHEVKLTVGLIPTIPLRSAGKITCAGQLVSARFTGLALGSSFGGIQDPHASVRFSPQTNGTHVGRDSHRTTTTRASWMMGKVIRVPALPSSRRIPF